MKKKRLSIKFLSNSNYYILINSIIIPFFKECTIFCVISGPAYPPPTAAPPPYPAN